MQAGGQRWLRTPAFVDAALLALPRILFFSLSGNQQQLPGLHNDEAQEAGLQAWQLAGGTSIDAFRNAGLGARNFP